MLYSRKFSLGVEAITDDVILNVNTDRSKYSSIRKWVISLMWIT